MVTKWKKKPVVIEAVQFNGENIDEVGEFVGEGNLVSVAGGSVYSIRTAVGRQMVSKSDYIIKGPTGKFCVCNSLTFHSIYEKDLVWDENI